MIVRVMVRAGVRAGVWAVRAGVWAGVRREYVGGRVSYRGRSNRLSNDRTHGMYTIDHTVVNSHV